MDSVWTLYDVKWEFLTKLCSSVPASPDIVAKWLEARQPVNKPAGAKSITEINEEVLASLETAEEEQFSGLVFQRDGGKIVMRAGTVRAHIKDCARILSAQFVARMKGERAFSTRVLNGVYTHEAEYWIPVLDVNGKPIKHVSGTYDKPIHVRGPRGEPMNALKRLEYINPGCQMRFTLKVLGSSVRESDLNHIFEYGGTHGYAGERGDGEGKYLFTITKRQEGRKK